MSKLNFPTAKKQESIVQKETRPKLRLFAPKHLFERKMQLKITLGTIAHTGFYSKRVCTKKKERMGLGGKLDNSNVTALIVSPDSNVAIAIYIHDPLSYNYPLAIQLQEYRINRFVIKG